MSYEGTDEFLCEKGHYTTKAPSWGKPLGVCKEHGCGRRFIWFHGIDETNGYDERDPRTYAAPKEESGWDDIPMEDHYGNKYFLKLMRYKPGQGWVDISKLE